MEQDPTTTDPRLYTVIFENERVRVLEYRDRPGDRTHEHHHGDSVMVTLSAFRRELTVEGATRAVELPAHHVQWLPAQDHVGHNVGDTDTHVLFVELKPPAPTGG
ncbi:cytoplasmic protein [Kocuria sp. LUK]|uniref:cytoplasmic protein n=1 Tax=Kocuria TaxID=57493 RepID=UPI001E5156FA|nr:MULTISPECIES: cytoplasmic protein [Kocuria]MCD1144677.1 cytoplasmic protein [Kocuria sp. LUK]MCJ8504566.1 cytoplasmic protein [Kocuria flava]